MSRPFLDTPLPEAAVKLPDTPYDHLYGEAKILADYIAGESGMSVVNRLLETYAAEREAYRQEQRDLWDAMRVEVDEAVAKDLAARPAGQAWTKYRRFVNFEERVGAMKCGNVSHRHGQRPQSEWVSYIGRGGRVVLCDSCYNREEGVSA